MNSEMLLIDTVEDLRSRAGLRASEYQVIQAAGLMRRLLIDRHPLVTTVQKVVPVDVEFTWHQTYLLTDENRFVMEVSSDPEMYSLFFAEGPAGSFTERTGSSKEFLAVPVIVQSTVAGGLPMEDLPKVTVEELIREYAHKFGGVHHDPSGSRNELLKAAQRVAPDQVLAAVATVGRIVVHALEPLCALAYRDDRQARRSAQALARLHSSTEGGGG